MTNVFSAARAPARREAAHAVLLAGFAASLFLSAFLLFAVQPMVSRMLLPRLGGSPAVWNACVCFFQAAVLLGYGYAHIVARRLRLRSQLALHGMVLAAALAALPLSMGADAPPAETSPIGWLLTRLTLAAGLPFVAIAATAPLLQHWFRQTGHPRARDPYFLYGASNAGSLLALLSYPVLIETTLDVPTQGLAWSLGFIAAAGAVLGCGVAASLWAASPAPSAGQNANHAASHDPKPSALSGPAAEADAPARHGEPLRWAALAFLPSALMLAVTAYITTDIAATPLFWAVPLAIYIGTYILAFARRQLLGMRILLQLQAAALVAAGVAGLTGAPLAVSLTIALAAFAFTAMVCHTELAQRRPEAERLTAYYFVISAGGALGGAFCSLAAPVLFLGPWEYPLLLVAACLMRPARPGDRRRLWMALALALLLLIPALADTSGTLITMRSFFGVHRLRSLPGEDLVVLQHGTTIHGVQSTRPGEELTPLGYYGATGPFGRAIAAFRRQGKALADVNLIGLGVGALACYARPGETWTFREIDPAVERIARDNRWLHFMTGCGNRPGVTLGDARLTLAADANARYDLLIVDAFSSDSVPVHLLTREALALYFARLKPGGVVLFHVTNRYLNLTPVTARLAADAKAPVRRLRTPPSASPLRQSGAEVVAIAAPGGDLDALAADGWDVPAAGPTLWTDERSDLLSVIRWR